MKLEDTVDVNYESINYLEEHITEKIWGMLFNTNFDKLPKKARVKITLEFEER